MEPQVRVARTAASDSGTVESSHVASGAHKRDGGKARIAVFDLDGTVIRGQSPAIMVYSMFKRGIIPLGTALVAGLGGLGYKVGFAHKTENVRERIFKTFRGRPVDEVDTSIGRVFREDMAHRVRPMAVERIQWHRGMGDAVVLVTASFDPIARLFADMLGVDGYCSTRMEITDGLYTGRIHGLPVEEGEKVRRLAEWADERFGVGGWEVGWSYADHETDFQILEISERSVAVSPKRRLAEIARERGWGIQDW